jgi:ammonium transporter, Amt family
VHGVGGIWGTLAVGIWAVSSVNGASGAVEGHWELLMAQAKAVGVCMAYSFVVSLGLFFVVDKVCRLRVSEHEERVGLDLTQHREAGYTVID